MGKKARGGRGRSIDTEKKKTIQNSRKVKEWNDENGCSLPSNQEQNEGLYIYYNSYYQTEQLIFSY